MYLTIHPLERVPLLEQHDWTGDVVSALGQGALAVWAGAQLGASRGALAALWPDETTAEAAAALEFGSAGQVLVRPGRVLRLTEVHHGPAAGRLPSVMQLAWFDGPRSREQSEADRRSGRRIQSAVEDVEGYVGALVAHAGDRAYVVAVLADGPPSLARAQERIVTSRLGPDEDPALLTGPDTIEMCSVVRATAPLTDFRPVLFEGAL